MIKVFSRFGSIARPSHADRRLNARARDTPRKEFLRTPRRVDRNATPSMRRLLMILANNDEAERRAVASATIEADLSQSSTLSLAHQRRYPRDRSSRLLEARVLPLTKTDLPVRAVRFPEKMNRQASLSSIDPKATSIKASRPTEHIEVAELTAPAKRRVRRCAKFSGRPPSVPLRPCAAVISRTAALCIWASSISNGCDAERSDEIKIPLIQCEGI